MNHIDLDDLSAYLDEELPADDKRRAEEHLAGCRVCRDELAALSWSVEFARAMPRAEVPFGASFHVPDAGSAPARRVVGEGGGWLAALATGSLALAGVALAIAVRQGGLASGSPLPAQNEPAAQRQALAQATAPAPDAADGSGEKAYVDRAEGVPTEPAAPAPGAVGGAGDQPSASESTALGALATAEAVATTVADAQPTAASAADQRARSRPRTASSQPVEGPRGLQAEGWLAIALGALTVAVLALARRRQLRR